jgi:UDP-N-acetylglucosamine--N-acetylmuramyl-(pentapeptide) pyrophosphoryl-undecaprenol N-acetylglucosamine transferase
VSVVSHKLAPVSSVAASRPIAAGGVVVAPGGIVIAAGGTGGHFFPAEALAAELGRRGHAVTLMTDARSGGLNSDVFAAERTVVLRGAGIAGRGAIRGAAAALALAAGTLAARRLLETLRPAVIVGFGGYPCVAPILATRLMRHRPAVVLHEQNAVLGRANRVLARFADRLALGMDGTRRIPARVAATVTGNPVRPAITALAATLAAAPYAPPSGDGPIRLLVTGGSLGARIFSDTVPAAVAMLPPSLRARLHIVQQCRAEDLDRVRAAYAALGVPAELSAFFPDMAERLCHAHFVVARAGASTVAELAALGRPALLVPLPGAIDGHQSANAASVDAAVLEQAEFAAKPGVLAEMLRQHLDCPDLLATRADAIAAHGRPHAAAALADLVEDLAAKATA